MNVHAVEVHARAGGVEVFVFQPAQLAAVCRGVLQELMKGRRKKVVGFYTTDIHTRRDTQADQKNLDYIAESLCNFTAKL